MSEQRDPYAPPRAPVFEPESSGFLEGLLNWLTDQDWGWWPIVRLRPPKSAPMTTRLVAKLSLFAGALLGPFFLFLLLRQGVALRWSAAWAISAGPIFFITYRLVFATAWNTRAERLRAAARRKGLEDAQG